jgi:hypothetical protein
MRRRRLVVLAGAAALTCLSSTGCSSAGDASSTGQTTGGTPITGGTYRLWTDGWEPGQLAAAALITGPFRVAITNGVACAWLGGASVRPFRWPSGWRVRLNPTELLDSTGHVVARAGQVVRAGGGTRSTADESSPCGEAGSAIWDVEGDVSTTGP